MEKNLEGAFIGMIPTHVKTEDQVAGIRVIKINREKALNALNIDVLADLKESLKKAAEDPGVRVIILTGAGEKAFIAGADIVAMSAMTQREAIEFSKLGQSVTRLIDSMPKPVIAAVNGFALGGGTEMAIACDFIFASQGAVFGQPEVQLGVIPGFGATARLAKYIGWPRAKELIFSGRKITAEEAKRVGLVIEIFPPQQLLSEVLKIAEMISKNSMSAIREAKSLMNDFSETTGMDQKLDGEAIHFGKLFESFDQKEGMAAFLERRKPIFKGIAK